MIRIGVKILLVSLTVCCEFIDDASPNETPKSTPTVSTMTETDFPLEEIIIQSSTETIPSYHDVKRQFNNELRILQKEAESCRKNYPKLSDPMYKLRMYRFLLNKLTADPKREMFFNCDINTELVDSARKKLKLLESFQKSFVQNPKNNSTESQKRQTNPPEELEEGTDLADFMEEGDDLRLKEEEEWKANVAHVSHIYLGRSMYPMITEESRVIENRPRPQNVMTSTLSPLPRQTQAPDLYTVEKVYKILSPSRWNKYTKTQETRFRRNLEETLKQIRERFRQFWLHSKEKLKGRFLKKDESTTTENVPTYTEYGLEQNEQNEY